MDAQNRQSLEKARSYVFSWRVQEAYNIYRRYFDRLPFQPEREHAEHIGLFVRVLFELGKEFELKFYLAELEKLYERERAPHIAYSLGVVYAYSGKAKEDSAKEIFEEIVRNPEAKEFHAKSKMMLADYYLLRGPDGVVACRLLIDSIEVPPDDRTMHYLVIVWKAVVARREKKLEEARKILTDLFAELSVDEDWYSYFSAKIVLAMTCVEQGDLEQAREHVAEVREIIAGRRLKMVQHQLDALEELIKEKSGLGSVLLVFGEDESRFVYADKTLLLKHKTPVERLLLQLVKKGFLDKALIVKTLYGRAYESDQDDKLVYYHVHSLRKRLKAIGLPADAVVSEANGYRFVPQVELVKGEGL